MEEIRLTALEKFLGAEKTDQLKKRLMDVIVDDFKDNIKNFSEFDYVQANDIVYEAMQEAKDEIKEKVKEIFFNNCGNEAIEKMKRLTVIEFLEQK